ncbi:hypothetical protein ACIBJC_08940 [Streptomyces sp. NPDC050509]|uniref:hypothetical protein n=1 Tax=Streptomyces sp. NPDC050509 TaxID=3365620 RepID=UPI0037BD34F9
MYWVDRDELHGWAATNTLDLRNPRRVLAQHTAIAAAHHTEQHDDQAQPRASAIVAGLPGGLEEVPHDGDAESYRLAHTKAQAERAGRADATFRTR